MAKQVVVLWDDNPIAVRTISAGGPVRVGTGDDADVMLPVESCVIEGDGDTSIGPFIVRVSASDETWARAPMRLGEGARYTALSALLHAALIAVVAIGGHLSPSDPGADAASRLAAMKGYVARATDHGSDPRPSPIVRRAVGVDVSDSIELAEKSERPAAVPTVARAKNPTLMTRPPHGASPVQHADTGSAGAGTSGALGKNSGAAFRAGDDWAGTYQCRQGRTDLVFHVVGIHDQDVSAVFDFTHAPTGVHGAYRMHGRVNPATGEALLTPDEWIQQPDFYVTVGMSGRFVGNAFNGTITSEGCGGFSLHKKPGKA